MATEVVDAAEQAAIARVRAGDRDAYAEVVRQHSTVAHRTAVLLGAGTEAEDIVQVSFVKAYRALGGFRADTPFRPWLLRIVANETRNAVRARKRRHAVTRRIGLLRAAEGPPDPATETITDERKADLLRAVQSLGEQYRLVVTCRFFLDLDEGETATVLGWPRGTVKSRLHRALRRLRAQLDADSTRSEAGNDS